jgi:16S rRNA (guanine(966)-N(2))-methyltransferase RsmD
MDRVKENVFNIVGVDVRDSRWLDLFGGTGSIGIEALSRGAVYCHFFETSREAIRTIQENLAATGLSESARIERGDALLALRNDPQEEGYDYVYIAPPQYMDLWKDVLKLLDARPEWLAPDGIAIVQIDPKEYETMVLEHLQLFDQRTYGNTMVCFYESPGE